MRGLPKNWDKALGSAVRAPWVRELEKFVDDERQKGPVFPREEHVFHALQRVDPDAARVVILGQDPYHGEGQAHGLAFSVPRGVAKPPSLVNMMRELNDDLGVGVPDHGCLEAWADRGVLLLNTVLTVRAGEAGSHAGKGWETFTDAVIDALARKSDPPVFVLWGTHAQKKTKILARVDAELSHLRPADAARARVLAGVHPSPLSAYRGFFGSKPFSSVDRLLVAAGHRPMDWSL